MKCYICGGEFDAKDLEPIFTGRRRMVCYNCLSVGEKEINGSRARYFYGSYEGKRRLNNSERKGK